MTANLSKNNQRGGLPRRLLVIHRSGECSRFRPGYPVYLVSYGSV